MIPPFTDGCPIPIAYHCRSQIDSYHRLATRRNPSERRRGARAWARAGTTTRTGGPRARTRAGALDDDVQAADLLQEYEAKIAALERMVGPAARASYGAVLVNEDGGCAAEFDGPSSAPAVSSVNAWSGAVGLPTKAARLRPGKRPRRAISCASA